MIYISEITQKIEDFLLKKQENKFKIFVRINFNIDVYVVTSNIVIAKKYQKEFCDSLYNESIQDISVDDFYKVHSHSLKINFIIVDEEYTMDDPFYENMFADNQKVDWGPRYRFDSLLQRKYASSEFSKSKKSTPVVTFKQQKREQARQQQSRAAQALEKSGQAQREFEEKNRRFLAAQAGPVDEGRVTGESVGTGHIHHGILFPETSCVAEGRYAAFGADSGAGRHYKTGFSICHRERRIKEDKLLHYPAVHLQLYQVLLLSAYLSYTVSIQP